MLSTGSLEDHGHHLASYDDTSLVVSAGVECGRRRRNVYDKKPQRCAKDNTTAHLTARSDKSVAYVTNNLKHSARRFVLLKLTTDRHEARAASLRQQSYLFEYEKRQSNTKVGLNFGITF